MRSIKLVFLLIFLVLLSACDLTNPTSGEEKAENVAKQFFQLLSDGKYAQAASMYSGDISELQTMNPSIEVNDFENLWRNACTINGYQCLPVKTILTTEEFSLNEFHLQVDFQNPDGSLFVLGPCCGATEQDIPPVSQFDVYVIERDGEYFVSSLPVLLP